MATRTRRKNKLLQERVVLALSFPGSGFTAGAKATGTIQCSTKANLVDTDYLTISDGMNPAVRYSFDTAGDGGTGVAVDVSGATTAATVAALLRTAILANQPGIAVVDAGAGLLTLTSNWPGTGANIAITENVAHASTTVSGMSGGLAEVATAITATTAIKFHKCAHSFLLESAELISPTGLVQDAANYFTITVKKGTTVMATWSTLTGQEGTLTADTFKTMTKSAVSGALDAAKDDVLSLVMTLTGTQTLPAGRLVVHGRYL